MDLRSVPFDLPASLAEVLPANALPPVEGWMHKHYRCSPAALVRLAKDHALSAKDTALLMVDHSLAKWEGLRESVLGDHRLRYDPAACAVYAADVDRARRHGFDPTGEVLRMGSESCALCEAYCPEAPTCRGCPLYQSRGGVACDRATSVERAGGRSISPWGEWAAANDPEPMIRALRDARVFVANDEFAPITNMSPACGEN